MNNKTIEITLNVKITTCIPYEDDIDICILPDKMFNDIVRVNALDQEDWTLLDKDVKVI